MKSVSNSARLASRGRPSGRPPARDEYYLVYNLMNARWLNLKYILLTVLTGFASKRAY